jgi:hypothetical protein
MGIRLGHKGLQTYQRCARFDCDVRIDYVPQQPPLYCSADCRVSANREIAWLSSEHERLDEALAHEELSRTERADLNSRRDLVAWHLRHYAPSLVDVR